LGGLYRGDNTLMKISGKKSQKREKGPKCEKKSGRNFSKN
jgi:hypothetical protein